jgi:hypothetical protein
MMTVFLLPFSTDQRLIKAITIPIPSITNTLPQEIPDNILTLKLGLPSWSCRVIYLDTIFSPLNILTVLTLYEVRTPKHHPVLDFASLDMASRRFSRSGASGSGNTSQSLPPEVVQCLRNARFVFLRRRD